MAANARDPRSRKARRDSMASPLPPCAARIDRPAVRCIFRRMNSAPALAILVHGLWMRGPALTVIKRRLEADGSLRALLFSYPTVVGAMSDHVRRLIDFAHAHAGEQLHFVGHSLGGLVILKATFSNRRPAAGARRADWFAVARLADGTAVGARAAGSHAAWRRARRRMRRLLAARMVGKARCRCDRRVARFWHGPGVRQSGRCARRHGDSRGNSSAGRQGPHRGGRVYTGMLRSAEVAAQTRYFLEHGNFSRQDRQDRQEEF